MTRGDSQILLHLLLGFSSSHLPSPFPPHALPILSHPTYSNIPPIIPIYTGSNGADSNLPSPRGILKNTRSSLSDVKNSVSQQQQMALYSRTHTLKPHVCLYIAGQYIETSEKGPSNPYKTSTSE